ncbi:MAG: RES family NAD+ phosphorylase [Bacteroidetes bacterium]|nr:RES family NAD+ phosphorylase [Bacteroidota bacterium]
MIVFRLGSNRYPDFLSGTGAEKTGGRWNSRGVKMVYTSESRSLCTAELAVHLPLGIVPADYEIVTIKIPLQIKIKVLSEKDLPEDWRKFPHSLSTQLIGNKFIRENKYAVFKVPSAVVPGDFNFLLNPYHRKFSPIRIMKREKFEFDQRLFRR